MIRLDRWLAESGLGSRSQVKKIIRDEGIRVNDLLVRDPGYKISEGEDRVFFEGEEIPYRPYIYLMMNKEAGSISAVRDRGEKTVIDYLKEEERSYRPFPVGRLDKDTQGLILLTNDGEFSHSITSPKKKIKKIYRARVKGFIDDRDIEIFERGIDLGDFTSLPSSLSEVEREGDFSILEIGIYEGKFHQVKRMLEYIKRPLIMLKRIGIGGLFLDESLGSGEYRHLTQGEIEKIFE